MKARFLKTLTILSFVLVFAAASFAQENKDDKQSKDNSQTKTEECAAGSGVVTLKVTFDKSGVITNVVLFKSSGCKDMDDEAVKAAKAIKFDPPKRNGEPYTTIKTIQYTFTKAGKSE
jgi:TonB family protein